MLYILKFGSARVYFTVQCSKCEKERTISTQENIGGPGDAKCEWGNRIFQDYETPFKYQATEKYLSIKPVKNVQAF